MVTLNYTVPVAPVTKKNSQQILTNPKNGRPFIVPSKAYKEGMPRADTGLGACPLPRSRRRLKRQRAKAN